MQSIVNKVIVGDTEDPIFTFENNAIDSIVEETGVSPIGDELFIDQFLPVVYYHLLVRYVIVPKDIDKYDDILTKDGYILCGKYNTDIRAIPYGTEVRFYSAGQNTGLYYVSSVERKGRDLFQINCVSAIGMMDKQRHKGNVYFGISFEDLLAEIIGDEYEYYVDPEVASIQVYGWLPYATKRSNLHQLLVAYGVTITKSDTGGMIFNFVKATDYYEIPDSRVFYGGNAEYGDPASRVEITEHAFHYLSSVEYETLLDTQGESVVDSVVVFDHPIYADSLTVDEDSSLVISSCGTNYAVVTGAGILTGQPYTHTTKLLTIDNPEATTEKVVTVEEATLITLANSDNCLARISEYYFNANTVTEDIVVADERTGRRYVTHNPFQEYMVGFMSRMSVNTTSFRRAECDFIIDYTPIAQGSSFLSRVIIEPELEPVRWYIPETVYEKDEPNIRVVLIGKGETGGDGKNGRDGDLGEDIAGGEGGKGGKGGAGGSGGRIYSFTLNCANLAWIKVNKDRYGNSIVVAGTKTYSSVLGGRSKTGFVEMFTGAVYALPGVAGYAGAAGGRGGYYSPKGVSSKQSSDGEDLTIDGVTYEGGQRGKTAKAAASDYTDAWTGGGGGGGAAYGANGHDGDTYFDESEEVPSGVEPKGGNGADAIPAPLTNTMYGSGGNGGNGGGGGGGGTVALWWNHVYTTLIATSMGQSGKGGKGSPGTEGADGCVILYY